jgi:hypothetical protein
MPEWDDLLANARAKRDARTEELRRLEAAQFVAADDLAGRRAKAEGDYVRTVEVFQRELHPSDYPLVQLTRTKKPLIGSQFKKARVLFIAGAGSEWWEVNKGYGQDPITHELSLSVRGSSRGSGEATRSPMSSTGCLRRRPSRFTASRRCSLITRASGNPLRYFLTFCCEHLRIGRPSTAPTSNFAWMSRRRARRPCGGHWVAQAAFSDPTVRERVPAGLRSRPLVHPLRTQRDIERRPHRTSCRIREQIDQSSCHPGTQRLWL